MADDDPAEQQQQRKIEAKRDYNRRLSARKRQQVKDEITALAAKVEFHADRADQMEKKNRELLEQVRALSEANQQLTERVQVLTAAIAGPAVAEGIGLASGHPSTTAAMRRLTQSNNTWALAVGSGGTAMMGGSSLDEGGGGNQRYMQQLAGHLLGTTAGTTSHRGGGLLGSNNNSNSISTPVVGRLSMDNLASTRGNLNLDLLIRLNSARNNKITNHLSGVPNAGALLLGSSVAAAAPRAVSAAPADSLITQLLLAAAAKERGNTNITSRDASSTTIPADILARLILMNQSSLSLGTGRPQSAAAAAAAGLSSFSQVSNQQMSTAVSDIEARERQRMMLALLERKRAEESTKWFNKPSPK